MNTLTRTSLAVCFRLSALDGFALPFIIAQILLTGLRSGLLLCHSSIEILFFFRNLVATFDRYKERHRAAVDVHV